jgi:hypothetical protein
MKISSNEDKEDDDNDDDYSENETEKDAISQPKTSSKNF